MKHQYFGDESDYKKYGVLRALTNNGSIKLLVCWLLTKDDVRSDGNKNGYLQKASEWRHHEPEIFDFLYDSVVVDNKKDLGLIEEKNIVPGAAYYTAILTDKLSEREIYFNELEKLAKGYDLVFFDPDNGIATPSVKKGRKNSSKYVFWDELERFWKNGHSLLIYQHFPRVDRTAYIKKLFAQMKTQLGIHEAYAIKTTYMMYLLLIQDTQNQNFDGIADRLQNKWGSVLDIIHLTSSYVLSVSDE